MFMYLMLRDKEPVTATMAAQEAPVPSPREEIRSHRFWKAARCEFLITLLYVFTGCGALTRWTDGQERPSEVHVSLAFGLAAATLVQCVGHISGAHLNPAVTLAMLVTRQVSVLRAVVYVLAQCAGGVTGAGILYGVTPLREDGSPGLGVTEVAPHVTLGQAFGVEFLITFLVVFTVFANLDAQRGDMGSRSLAIGLAVVLGHLMALKYTGAGMNPARCLGPAVVMNAWKDHWVYWVGPLLGGILGGFTYEYTHDSRPAAPGGGAPGGGGLQRLRRSFRRSAPAVTAPLTPLTRSRSSRSNDTLSTEMTYTSEDLRI